MKQRARKHLIANKHGYMTLVVSERVPSGGPDPFTDRIWPKRTVRVIMKQGRGFKCWREL